MKQLLILGLCILAFGCSVEPLQKEAVKPPIEEEQVDEELLKDPFYCGVCKQVHPLPHCLPNQDPNGPYPPSQPN